MRRLGAGPVGSLLGRKNPTGQFFISLALVPDAARALLISARKHAALRAKKRKNTNAPFFTPARAGGESRRQSSVKVPFRLRACGVKMGS